MDPSRIAGLPLGRGSPPPGGAEAKGPAAPPAALWAALRGHWPEYLMEAAGLGLFMISACVFGSLLEHPASPVRQAIPSPLVRRALMGLAMGLTAVSIIYSPWGKRSGAHLNPAITLTFLRLGKVEPRDGLLYVLAQFAGGVAGVLVAAAALGPILAHPAVNFVATRPGAAGPLAAFLAEVAIAFILMLVVLESSNRPRLARFTGLFAGALVASYILLEAEISGMSLNPARTFASALPPRLWDHLWVYFTAPLLGMLLAAQAYRWGKKARPVFCAKLHHHNDQRCIFRCNFPALVAREAEMAAGARPPARGSGRFYA